MALPNAPFPITPLKYIGGKTQLAKRIIALFPYAPPVIASPFTGGGAAECARPQDATRRGHKRPRQEPARNRRRGPQRQP